MRDTAPALGLVPAIQRRPLPHVVRGLLTSGLAWGSAASIGLAIWILFGLGGLEYYRTPLTVRGYADAHAILRPSGPAGQTFGLVGALLLLVPFAYMVRKRIRRRSAIGSAPLWLQIHLFCGIAGPVLITFHTSFKFNGIVSAAYWSMVLVMLSGFVGRYLYVRIPRSIRGIELTRAELDAEAATLAEEIDTLGPSGSALAAVREFERAAVPSEAQQSFFNLVFGELSVRRQLKALVHALDQASIQPDLSQAISSVSVRRAILLRRAAYLRRTKQLFDLWHVFHLPLVYLLLVIAALHVAVVVYLGYVPFRW